MEPQRSALQDEIRQQRPFPSKAQEAALGLLKTADLVRRLIAHVLEPHGVTPQQYNVLRILRGAGATGIPTLTIAERMIEQTPGVTRLLDRIEAKGWAERKRCSGDRRQVLCFLTPAGAELLCRLDEPVERIDREAVGDLSDDDLGTLIRLLDTIRAAHAAPPPECEPQGDSSHE